MQTLCIDVGASFFPKISRASPLRFSGALKRGGRKKAAAPSSQKVLRTFLGALKRVHMSAPQAQGNLWRRSLVGYSDRFIPDRS